MDSPLSFAIQLVRKTGKLLLDQDFFASLQINIKSDYSVVTQADLAADESITQAIQEQYPNELILSEERQSSYVPSDVSTVPATWIIDPLDGSTNFSLGLHIWGILVTHVVKGWPESTAMYFPMLDELYSAQKGQGAYLNGRRIQISPPDPQRPFTFFACCSRTFRQYQVGVPYKARIFGSAAFSMCSVARGISLLGFEAAPKIWDIAGSWLLVREAGGIIETLDGSQPFPLRADVDYSQQSFPTLAAATVELAAKAHHQIQSKPTPTIPQAY